MVDAGLRHPQKMPPVGLVLIVGALVGAGTVALTPLLFAFDNHKVAHIVTLELGLCVLLLAMLFDKDRDPAAPIYFYAIIVFAVFVLRPVYLLFQPGELMRGLNYSFESYLLLLKRVLEHAILGSLGFIMGYRLPWRKALGDRLSASLRRVNSNVTSPSSSRAVAVSLVAFVIGATVYGALMQSTGGIGFWLQNMRAIRTLLMGRYYYVLGLTLMNMATLMLVHVLWGKRKLLVIPVFLVTFAANVVLAGRAQVFSLIGPLILLWIQKIRRGTVMAVVRITIVICLVVAGFVFYRVVRNASRSDQPFLETAEIVMTNRSERMLADFVGEFVELDVYLFVVDVVPRSLDFMYGRTFTDIFVWFIPRALWPDKPVPIDFLVRELIQGGTAGTGYPFTLVGELFLNFNWIGIAVGLFAVGVLCRAFYVWYRRMYRKESLWFLLYFALWPYFYKLFTRPFVVSASQMLSTALIFSFLCLWIRSGKRRRRHARAAIERSAQRNTLRVFENS